MTAMITDRHARRRRQLRRLCRRPAGTPSAAIVVIQEIFGVNAGIRRKCDTLAAAGYLAIAPDLFWRFEPGIELDPDVADRVPARRSS